MRGSHMIKLLENIFGSSWRTSLLGWIFTVSTSLSVSPDILVNIGLSPDTISSVKNAASVVAFLSGAAFAKTVKDSKVTGGSVPATREAAIRISDEIDTKTAEPELQTNLKKLE